MKDYTIRSVICTCGNDTYRKDIKNGIRVWVCLNCYEETKRQVRIASVDTRVKRLKERGK